MRWVAALAIVVGVAAFGAAMGTSRADDWGVRRDPFDPGVVRRYKAILAKDPHDDGALRALVSLYTRYRSVATLEAEYRAAPADDWASVVVLARLPRASRSDTAALWARALAIKPDDARGWLAAGDLAIEPTKARDAFQQAAKRATTPKLKQAALVKVIGAARSANDAKAIDAAYAELIALAPKDGKRWLERGNAQLAAGQAAAARDSFVTAEGLLTTDPERRLTAMVNQGLALERLGRVDDAMAQYERTLDKVPRGFYIANEIIPRIVDIERKRKQLAAGITRIEKRWPERSRGHFEWDLLGDLYKEAGDDARALDAYRRAVARAPTEVVTQRKLIALLDKLQPADALAQHEAAARVAPGDADIQIELAKRYHATQPAKAFAVLDRLTKRLPKNVNVRRTLAALYDAWNEPVRALVEYEALADIEPEELDHAITLGEAHWRMSQFDKAKLAWRRLDKVGSAVALLRHGEVLANHELWAEAVIAYTASVGVDGSSPDAWRGRARANEELNRVTEAIEDARRAVALIGTASHSDGQRERYIVARVLGRWEKAGGGAQVSATLARWRFAFDHGDVAAGYILAAHHQRIGSHQLHGVLVELYRRVPTDDTLGIALARSFAKREDYARARKELEQIGRRSPNRAKTIDKLIAQLDLDRERAELDARWTEEGLDERERLQRRSGGGVVVPDLVGRNGRFGMRLALGADVDNTEAAVLGIGLYRTWRVARGTAIAGRFEWQQRDDEMEEINAVSLAGGITTRLLDTRKLELAAGIGPRFELRYGSSAGTSAWDRAALAGDVTLELMPRAIPATLGVRFTHVLTEASRASTVMFELGFEVR